LSPASTHFTKAIKASTKREQQEVTNITSSYNSPAERKGPGHRTKNIA
jgi:hypothetical protein